ncbi:MAG: helix-turn-helix transcriptional regulator [Myxococcaceae bacterium]|nr:helix-turn-helix transcriptional regulator [Myxococcaceae bacterium]
MFTLRFERDPDRLSREFTHAEPVMVLPLDSTVLTLSSDGLTRRLDRSAFALVPARTAYGLEVQSAVAPTLVLGVQPKARDAARREYAPHFTNDLWARVVERPRVFARTRWVDELASRYLFERHVCQKHGSAAAWFLEVELTKELFYLGKEQLERSTRPSQVEQPTDLLRAAQQYLEAHLFEPVALPKLARECHTSESTLLRVFRRELGVPPTVYLRNRRLDEALLLLESRKYSVSEVSARIGYSNLPAFTAAFSRRFGSPPSRVQPQTREGHSVLPPHGSVASARALRVSRRGTSKKPSMTRSSQ